MIVAAIHSSTPILGIAVVEDGRMLAEETLTPGKEHLENIAPLFAGVMDKLGMHAGELDGLGVAVGPGSFSGIRVGMSFVKGLALAVGTRVTGVSSLEILARYALADGERGAAVIDARRGQVYVATYHRSADVLIALDAPQLIRATEFPEFALQIGQDLVLCGDPIVETLAESCTNTVRAVTALPSAFTCAYIAWERLKNGNAESLHALEPLYIRRSDAEENKRARMSPIKPANPTPQNPS